MRMKYAQFNPLRTINVSERSTGPCVLKLVDCVLEFSTVLYSTDETMGLQFVFDAVVMFVTQVGPR